MPKTKWTSYDVKTKLKVVSRTGDRNRAAGKELDVAESGIRTWKNDKVNLSAVNSTAWAARPGKNNFWSALESVLKDWIKHQRVKWHCWNCAGLKAKVKIQEKYLSVSVLSFWTIVMPKTKWTSYDVKTKLKVVSCAEDIGNRAADKEVDVLESGIRTWWNSPPRSSQLERHVLGGMSSGLLYRASWRTELNISGSNDIPETMWVWRLRLF